MMHWAAQYIGRPWGPPGSGLSCWEFVRHVLLQHYDCPMPEMPVDALQVPGWSRIASLSPPERAPAADGDVLLLRSWQLHTGVVIESGGALRLLHADGDLRAGRPYGHVVAQPLADAIEGYRRVEVWRRHAPA
jgi:hypothetical protein